MEDFDVILIYQQILRTNIERNVRHSARRIDILILVVEGFIFVSDVRDKSDFST